MMTSHSIIILLNPSIQFPNIKIPKGHHDVAYEQYGRFQTTTHTARAQRTKADASNGSVCRVTEDCSVPTQTAWRIRQFADEARDWSPTWRHPIGSHRDSASRASVASGQSVSESGQHVTLSRFKKQPLPFNASVIPDVLLLANYIIIIIYLIS